MSDLRTAAEAALEALDSDSPDIQLRAAVALRAALDAQEPTRKAATDKEIDAEWLKIKPVFYPMHGLGDFRDGFRAAERFHGIKQEGET